MVMFVSCVLIVVVCCLVLVETCRCCGLLFDVV